MNRLIVVYNNQGDIKAAGCRDVKNINTYQMDGYLLFADGKKRLLSSCHYNTLCVVV